MKLKFFNCLTALCLLCSIVLCSCGASGVKNKYSTHSFEYFDTVSTITGYECTEEEFDAVAEEVLTLLGEYHRLYTIYHRFDGLENLCTINELVDGHHRTVKVDIRIIDMLLYAREMYYKTDGMLNVAMGSVLSLWHDYRTIGMDDPSTATLPPEDKLLEAAEHCDIEKMIIDVAESTVTLTDPEMKLDVGAIAKGYATEQIAKHLESKGVSGYVLNIGGNVRAVGAKPDGEAWTVGVENPQGEDYLSYLKLTEESVVTSGSHQRYYLVDGKRYHHIIHPGTLMPAEGFISVSIVCKDSALGDALSTSLFCMSLEDGLTLVESIGNAEALWLSEDGSVTTSEGWNAYAADQNK